MLCHSRAMRRLLRTAPAGLAALATLGLAVSGCGSSGGQQHAGTSPDQTPQGKSSDTIDLGKVDGYTSFTVHIDSVEKKTPCMMTSLPARNGDYVEVHLTFTAKKSSPKAQSPLLVGDWSVQDSTGHVQPADYSRTMLCLPRDKQLPTTLDRSGRASGGLIFDIPKDATRLIDKISFVQPTRKIVLGLTGSKPQTHQS